MSLGQYNESSLTQRVHLAARRDGRDHLLSGLVLRHIRLCYRKPYQTCQKKRETHSLVRLALGVACKTFNSSDASDASGEAARFRLLLWAFTGAIGKCKPSSNESKWTLACISGPVVEISQVRMQRDFLLFVPMARFSRLGWRQGEK